LIIHLRAFIFDLDGTLLYTLEDIADAMNLALLELHLQPYQLEEYRWLVGGGAENIALKALPEFLHSEQNINDFVASFRTHYRLNWHAKTRPYSGIPELIGYLRAKHYPLAVLSNKPQEFTYQIVQHFFHHSQTVFNPVWGQREDFTVKPDPATALAIADFWKLAPEQVGFIGDSDVDMETALKAGMTALGAGWGFRGEEELVASGAQIMLRHPLELIKYVE